MTTHESKCYWVYILECENGAYYTGYTNDLIKRFTSHAQGNKTCKFTRSFKPIRILQCWQIMGEKKLAMQIEHLIKKLSRKNKEKIIEHPTLLSKDPRVIAFEREKLETLTKN